MSKRIAKSLDALVSEIDSRMTGAPRMVWDGNAGRMVPVAYDVEIVPLVSDEQYRARELRAREADRRGALSPRMQETRDTALRLYVHAQQSDEGIGTAFMTRTEREIASREWSDRVRALVRASESKRREADRLRVVVDLGDE